MTKLLIFSDSHGSTIEMKKIILSIGGSIQYIIHAGDLVQDAELLREFPHQTTGLPEYVVIAAPGNCDYTESAKKGRIFAEIDGKKICVIHGHRDGVKLGGAKALARDGELRECDLVIFGHTHIPEELYVGNTIFFNPGSVARPRSIAGKTYGIVTIDGGRIKTNIEHV